MSSSPYVEALQSFYNTMGQKYNGGPMSSFHRESAKKIVDAAGLSIKEGSWVLDLATGTGNVALAAASKVGSTGRVLGIDISDEFLRIASQTADDLGFSEFVDFVQRDVEHLALPEPYTGRRCFDAVTCGSAIAMFPSPKTVLAVVATQLLKPGGVLIADMHGTHVPAKVFLDVAVPRGFQAPMDSVWLNEPAEGLRGLFENSAFELKGLTTSNVLLDTKWDLSTVEATEKLWENIAIESTWISFGVEKLGPEIVAEIKQAWVEKLSNLKGSDGFIVGGTRQYLAVAILKGEDRAL